MKFLRRRQRRVIVPLAVMLTTWGVIAAAPAQAAAANLDVQVGAPLFENPAAGGAPADGMRFYAPTLQVHVGDTITFVADGFHTATVLPANTDVNSWVEDETSFPDGAYAFIIPDPDDGGTTEQPALKGNNAVIFPSVDGAPAPCAGDAGDPCDAGAAVVNSGVAFDTGASFTVAMTDVSVGDTVWTLCLVHRNMRLRIRVVDAGTPATTQAEIDAYRDATILSDAETANALHHKLLTRQSKHTTANGTVVWDAYAGFDGRGFALDGMYPRKLVIHKGQKVRWHFDQLRFEDHTVTFPFARAKEISANSFVPLCDTDGAGSAPRTPADQPPPTFCSSGEVEFAIPPNFAYRRGDGVFNGNDLQSSGVNGANLEAGSDPYTLKFGALSPAKGFKYMCMIHGTFMSGRVVVKPG